MVDLIQIFLWLSVLLLRWKIDRIGSSDVVLVKDSPDWFFVVHSIHVLLRLKVNPGLTFNRHLRYQLLSQEDRGDIQVLVSTSEEIIR